MLQAKLVKGYYTSDKLINANELIVFFEFQIKSPTVNSNVYRDDQFQSKQIKFQSSDQSALTNSTMGKKENSQEGKCSS